MVLTLDDLKMLDAFGYRYYVVLEFSEYAPLHFNGYYACRWVSEHPYVRTIYVSMPMLELDVFNDLWTWLYFIREHNEKYVPYISRDKKSSGYMNSLYSFRGVEFFIKIGELYTDEGLRIFNDSSDGVSCLSTNSIEMSDGRILDWDTALTQLCRFLIKTYYYTEPTNLYGDVGLDISGLYTLDSDIVVDIATTGLSKLNTNNDVDFIKYTDTLFLFEDNKTGESIKIYNNSYLMSYFYHRDEELKEIVEIYNSSLIMRKISGEALHSGICEVELPEKVIEVDKFLFEDLENDVATIVETSKGVLLVRRAYYETHTYITPYNYLNNLLQIEAMSFHSFSIVGEYIKIMVKCLCSLNSDADAHSVILPFQLAIDGHTIPNALKGVLEFTIGATTLVIPHNMFKTIRFNNKDVDLTDVYPYVLNKANCEYHHLGEVYEYYD